MANSITTQVLVQGPKNAIIKVNIVADGSGEETNTVIFDQSAYWTDTTNNKLMAVEYGLNGFSALLLWDATANVPLISLAEQHAHVCPYEWVGGIYNNAGTGRTGDILITTSGLGTSGENGHIILHVQRKDT